MRRRTSSPSVATSRPSTRGASLRRREQAAEDADERRLARAVGAEQAVDLAARHVQRDLVERANRPEVAGHALAPRCRRRSVGGCLAPVDRSPGRHSSSRTVAAMPGFSSGVGSIATFTPNTWSMRWSSVWTLRGVYSACVADLDDASRELALRERVDRERRLLPDAHAAELRLRDVDAHPELRRARGSARPAGSAPTRSPGPQVDRLDDAAAGARDDGLLRAGARGSRAAALPRRARARAAAMSSGRLPRCELPERLRAVLRLRRGVVVLLLRRSPPRRGAPSAGAAPARRSPPARARARSPRRAARGAPWPGSPAPARSARSAAGSGGRSGPSRTARAAGRPRRASPPRPGPSRRGRP